MFSGAAKGMVIIYRKWIGMHGWDSYCYFRDGKMTGSFLWPTLVIDIRKRCLAKTCKNGGNFLNEK